MKKANEVKRHIYGIIQLGNKETAAGRSFDYLIVTAIVVNLVILIAGTFSVPEKFQDMMSVIDYITLVIFVIEYVLRIYTADCMFPHKSRIEAVLAFVLSFYGLIDLFSILPYFLPLFLPKGIVALRVLRVFRVLRLFRINAQYDAFNVVVDVIRGKKNQLAASVVMISTIILASSIVMYYFEHEVQPDAFPNALSGVWWAVSAIFTIGYGDIYPVTAAGKLFAIVISFMGVGMVAVPTGIISAGFMEQYSKIKSMAEMTVDSNLKFIMITVHAGHEWVGKTLSEITLPPQIMVISIVHEGKILIPRGNTPVSENDQIIFSALELQEEIGIRMREVVIDSAHLWKDKKIKALHIPDSAVVVSISRHGENIIPNGETIVRVGDRVTLCEKNSDAFGGQILVD